MYVDLDWFDGFDLLIDCFIGCLGWIQILIFPWLDSNHWVIHKTCPFSTCLVIYNLLHMYIKRLSPGTLISYFYINYNITVPFPGFDPLFAHVSQRPPGMAKHIFVYICVCMSMYIYLYIIYIYIYTTFTYIYRRVSMVALGNWVKLGLFPANPPLSLWNKMWRWISPGEFDDFTKLKNCWILCGIPKPCHWIMILYGSSIIHC